MSSSTENMPDLPPSPPRESMISTAVKFLQNPKVLSSPLSEKKQFLIKKGLTEEEIEIAVSRAGTTSDNAVVAVTPQGHLVTPPHTVSIWTRIREYSAVAIIIGGVIYGLYSIYKRFIEPILLRSSEEQQKKLEEMEEGVKGIKDELGQNMQEIRDSMHEMQEKILAQTMKLSQVSADFATSKVESGYSSVSNSSIGELKAEITSIKGLLLSRNQFPSQPLTKPAIPSWQMKEMGNDHNADPSSKPNEETEDGDEETGKSDNDDTTKTTEKDLHSGKTIHMNGFSTDGNDMQNHSESTPFTDE